MDYISVAEAIDAPGLRLVLTAGVPGPWGESAKSILQLKQLPYTAVRQIGGAENTELQAWTGQSSAPVAVNDNEQPCSHSLDILYLAERLNPSPPLIPKDIDQRMQMFGFIQEIIGEQGFAWQRRLMMLQPIMGVPGMEDIAQRLGAKYGFTEEAASRAPRRCVEILNKLVAQLKSQHDSGSRYFIGEQLTALDVYWANFSGMLRPLPPEVNPMPEMMRQTYETVPEEVMAAADDVLFQHRDFIYAEHLILPLDY
jgi:glutathione S-transferase